MREEGGGKRVGRACEVSGVGVGGGGGVMRWEVMQRCVCVRI